MSVATPLVATGVRSAAPPDALEQRILDAALELVARWGVTKTSVADVARTAGCGRATLYRVFPGGKHELFGALAQREMARYLHGIGEAVDRAGDLRSALAAAVLTATRRLGEHDAFQFLLEHEPGLLLPYLGFGQVDRLYELVADAIGPHLQRFLAPDRAAWAAEWVARLLITFVFNPTEGADLADHRQATDLVSRYLVPAFTSPSSPT